MSRQLTEIDDNKLDIDLADLHNPKGHWTAEDKINAVMAYTVTGTSTRASKNLKAQTGTDIPSTTIRRWKTQSIWWPDVYAECKKKKQDELDASFTDFIHTAIEEVKDRVKNGNYVLNKQGEQVRLPMGGKEAAWCLGVFFDKRQLLRGDPTSRVEKVSEADRLDSLEQSFKNMSNSVQGLNSQVIEGEVLSGSKSK